MCWGQLEISFKVYFMLFLEQLFIVFTTSPLVKMFLTDETPENHMQYVVQWKLLIMITLGLALFVNNKRLITLSRGYKNLLYLAQFIVTVQHFTCIKNNKIYLRNLCSVACCWFAISTS
jgi:hypothetical protein